MSSDILIVEDEAKLAALMADFLRADGHTPRWVGNGDDVAAAVADHMPDLVILDLMLPGKGGREVCKELRASSDVPIVMLTAQVEEDDRLLGLELGADDYICKPFSLRELVARVKAILRRARQSGEVSSGWRLDEGTLTASFAGGAVRLSSVEFRIMETLANAPGRVFSREVLMDRAYDDHRVVSDRTIDSHVKKLRRKLEPLAPHDEIIESVYGAGYRLLAP